MQVKHMKQILLADDNSDLCSALRLLLETRLDLQLITEARDMEHVLTQAEDTLPDCIILDWELPGQPVRERIKVLRTLVPGMKILVTSTRPESREEALSEGADAFADKADSPLLILEAMRECMKEKEGSKP
jgi:DNA-binding NarL/FixJ family response regulator